MSHETIIPENSPERILRVKGYSLWLVPEGKELEELNNLVDELAKKFNAPLFIPHVTILGGIDLKEEDVIAKTRQIAINQEAFDIELNEIKYEGAWNRALFIRGKDSPELTNLFKNSHAIFQAGNPPPISSHEHSIRSVSERGKRRSDKRS